jgi:hypothetical protein
MRREIMPGLFWRQARGLIEQMEFDLVIYLFGGGNSVASLTQ